MTKDQFLTSKCVSIGELLEKSKQESHRQVGKALRDIAKLTSNEKAFRMDLMMELQEPYRKMSAWWATFTKGMGRQVQLKTVKEMEKITGISITKALKGIDVDGFNQLQAMSMITQEQPMFQDQTFNLLFWACMISCYKPEFAADLSKTTTKVLNKNLN